MIGPLLIFGALGWIFENAFLARDSDRPLFSKAFGGLPVPLLPVYAIGGTAVWMLAPHLRGLSLLAKFGIYAAGLSALEYGVCRIDRSEGVPSWAYANGSCVDVPHALGWGGLGLLVGEMRG